nr:FGGY-family carbohydrate kinase [Halobacillus sp. A5]
MGTSTCHIMLHKEQKSIPGISGSVKDAIIPNLYAYEAGQSAVGDLFDYATRQAPLDYWGEAEEKGISIFQLLERKAASKEVGETGLLALDWHNGNRSLLSDTKLRGLLIGETLHTACEDIFKAYMEATAYGTKMIMKSYENYGLTIDEIFACGGLPKKNSLLMQIYADVLQKPIHISSSEYAPAVGAAILGALAGGSFSTMEEAIEQMKQPFLKTVYPVEENAKKYEKLFQIYNELHEQFGVVNKKVMYDLQSIQ